MAGPPPTRHAAIGLSDEDPAAYSSPYTTLLRRRLGLGLARFIVAFDAPAALSRWLSGAGRSGFGVYVSLSGDDLCVNPIGSRPPTGNCPPPSDSAFTAAFRSLVRAAPNVRAWGAWSEPSNYRYWSCARPPGSSPPPAGACGQVRMTAARAAAYWADAHAADRALGRSDTIVAGETGADCVAPALNLCPPRAGRPWSGYVVDYLRALGSLRPTVWGTHSYHDVQLRTALPATETDAFVRYLGASEGAPQIWLTEEGAWLGGIAGHAIDGDAAAQAAAARAFLALPEVPSARPGQIAREYWYLLRAKGGATFDSGLLDVEGRPRASYCVLVGAPRAQCGGDPRNER